jgi:hypothetical protein
MFIPVMESMQKISASTAEIQQEMFKRWFGMWPAFPATPGFAAPFGEQFQRFQKRWTETVGDLLRRQRETVEARFKAGQQNLERAFHVGEAKSPEELRAKTIEFWQKCIESVRQTSEAQIRDFQVAVEKCCELMAPAFPPT